MILDVPEVGPQFFGDQMLVQPNEFIADVCDWQSRAAQLEHLPLQVIETFNDEVVGLVLEYVGLDGLEISFELGDDGLIVIDHEVNQRIQAEAWPLGEHICRLLAAVTYLRVARRRPMPDRNQEVRTDEQMRLAIDDLALLQLGRLQHDEQRVAVSFNLGTLVRIARVFDRELVKVEFFLDLQQHRVVRLVQAKPDECVWLLDDLADIVDRNVPQSNAIFVGYAIDNHGHGVACFLAVLSMRAMPPLIVISALAARQADGSC